jgi:uncharacterized protein YdeI (YjbR/CyaY-like superfamily)
VSETPELLVADAATWRTWLEANHATSAGVRLVLAKKGVTEPTSLTYDDALVEALCYGWIDGHLTRRDDATYRVRFTPRRSRSAWSQRNVDKAEQLITDGRMQPAGLAEVERAKADGRWQKAYSGSRTNRYAVLYRVHEAKRPETRARRITQYVEMLARGETPHPQKEKPT